MGVSRAAAGDLQKLLTKYILVSSVAILSNLFSSIWFAVTDILIFTYLDVFLNPICLILMQIHHDDIYTFMCKYCHRSLGRMLDFPEPSTTENIMLDIQGDVGDTPRSPAMVGQNEMMSVPPVSPTADLQHEPPQTPTD